MVATSGSVGSTPVLATLVSASVVADLRLRTRPLVIAVDLDAGREVWELIVDEILGEEWLGGIGGLALSESSSVNEEDSERLDITARIDALLGGFPHSDTSVTRATYD